MSATRYCRAVFSLSWSDRWLLCECICALIYAKCLLSFFSFKRVAKRMGASACSLSAVSLLEDARALHIAQMVARAAVPLRLVCLPQAVAAFRLLSRRHISCVLYLGVAKDTSMSLIAHAWVRVGRDIVIGQKGATAFTVVAAFAKETST